MKSLGVDRDRALDVFRGATVALMILVNNPGSWKHLYPPLAHAPWHGCTLTDWVFPFFLFAVGNALALTSRSWETGRAAAPGLGVAQDFGRRWVHRTAWIFGVGLFLNASPFVRWDAQGDLVWRSWETLRIMGVLQRIALCWALAAIVVWWAGTRGAWWAVGVALLGYWAACLGLAHGSDPYSLEGFFGTHLDRAVLGASHLYRGEGVPFDPEGLASTVPAVAQVLLGYLVGQAWLQRRSHPRGVWHLAMLALGLCALGALWELAVPLNKKIWTPSYVLWTTGWATAVLSTILWVQQRKQRKALPSAFHLLHPVGGLCVAFGRNALAVFALSGLVPRVIALWRIEDGLLPDGSTRWITPWPLIYRTVFEPLTQDPRASSLMFALANLALYGALAWWLDRRGLYWRV